jgi:hypothetical protein
MYLLIFIDIKSVLISILIIPYKKVNKDIF